MGIKLGTIGHIVLAASDPTRSARWWIEKIGLRKEFEFKGGVVLGNDDVALAFFKGKPRPEAIEHISFHLPNMKELKAALAHLKRMKVDVEDPGDEIGPEAPGSRNYGLWFRDLDGYRWELSVLNAVPAARKG